MEVLAAQTSVRCSPHVSLTKFQFAKPLSTASVFGSRTPTTSTSALVAKHLLHVPGAETLILPVGNILVQPSCTGIILEQLVGSNWNSVSSSSLGIAATMISLGPSSGFVAAKRSRNQARSKVTKPEVVASTNSSFEVVPVSVSATLAPRQASIELA